MKKLGREREHLDSSHKGRRNEDIESGEIERLVLEASGDFDEVLNSQKEKKTGNRLDCFGATIEKEDSLDDHIRTPPTSIVDEGPKLLTPPRPIRKKSSNWELAIPDRWQIFQQNESKMLKESQEASNNAISQAMEIAAEQEMTKHLNSYSIKDSLVLSLLENDEKSVKTSENGNDSCEHSPKISYEKPWLENKIHPLNVRARPRAPDMLSLIPSSPVPIEKEQKLEQNTPKTKKNKMVKEALRMLNVEGQYPFFEENQNSTPVFGDDDNNSQEEIMTQSFKSMDRSSTQDANLEASRELMEINKKKRLNSNEFEDHFNLEETPCRTSRWSTRYKRLQSWHPKIKLPDRDPLSPSISFRDSFRNLNLSDIRLTPQVSLKLYEEKPIPKIEIRHSKKRRVAYTLSSICMVTAICLGVILSINRQEKPSISRGINEGLGNIIEVEHESEPFGNQVSEDTKSDSFSLYVLTDNPRSLKEDVVNFPEDADFGIHIGGIFNNKNTCDNSIYDEVKQTLQLSKVPFLALPANSDWCLCSNPVDALESWRSSLGTLDTTWEKSTISSGMSPLMRQAERPENFAFVSKKTLIIGLNIVENYVLHGDTIQGAQDNDNLNWTRFNLQLHQDTFNAIIILGHAAPTISQYEGYFHHISKLFQSEMPNTPILYVHSGNQYNEKKNIYTPYSGMKINLQAAFVGSSENTNPLKVSVQISNENKPKFSLN